MALKKFLVIFISVFLIKISALSAQSTEKLLKKAQEAFESGNYSEAAMHYTALLKKNVPDSALIFYSLGNVYFYWNDYPNAIWFYTKALDQKYSAKAEIYYSLSTIYYNKKDYQKSIDYCKKMMPLLPSDPRPYRRLNVIYSLMDEPEDATAIMKEGAKKGIKEFQIFCEKRDIQWQ